MNNRSIVVTLVTSCSAKTLSVRSQADFNIASDDMQTQKGCNPDWFFREKFSLECGKVLIFHRRIKPS